MTPEQTEILEKLAEIEEQMNRLLDEMSDAPGLVRRRVLHARNLSRYLRRIITPATLTLVKSGTASG
jgi:hypothetical protein